MAGLAKEGSQFDVALFKITEKKLLSQSLPDVANVDDVKRRLTDELFLRAIIFYNVDGKTPAIQQRRIVSFCKDLHVIQQTYGTGKTETLCAGILGHLDYGFAQCQALVLTHTRELAQHFEKVMREYGY